MVHDLSELEFLVTNDKERMLLENAKHELTSQNGNFGAASDLTRWLKSVIKMGIYSDLDVQIKFKNLPSEIPVRDFIFQIEITEEGEISCNNCFLAIPNADHKIVDDMQNRLCRNYEDIDKGAVKIAVSNFCGSVYI